MRFAPLLLLLITRLAHATPFGDPAALAGYSRLWPATLDAHMLVGVEPHGVRGAPVAFGVGVEALWRGRVGGYAALLSSEGTPIAAVEVNGVTKASLADRVSVPIALAWRPFQMLTPLVQQRSAFGRRLLEGIGVQVGISVEHLRTSDDSATTAGLHLGLGVELPLFGGPVEGGLSLRLYGRLLVTKDVRLDTTQTQIVFEPGFSGQIFGGLAYYP